MTTSDGTVSQPESLDLDYDDWEGQFEFVGPTTSSTTTTNGKHSSSHNKSSSDDDDLNFNIYVPNNEPILIDDETFLSLQPNDFDDSGPPSELFIEDCGDSILKKCNKDTFNNKFLSAKYHAEELNNYKNKLLSDEFNMKGLKSTGNSNNINTEFAADLCDNLSEQVGFFYWIYFYMFFRI